MKRIALALAAGLALTTTGLLAGNEFARSTSTASGYSTWDSDMINIEAVAQTGRGVYVAVLDTGLVPNWRDYFPRERIAEKLGAGFEQSVTFRAGGNPCQLEVEVEVGQLRRTTWVGSTGSTHGTHVASTIIGYSYQSEFDAVAGFALPPIQVRGIAPDATIIPVKVLADYQVPPAPQCPDPNLAAGGHVVFGTSKMIAAGLDYVTDLALAGYRPMVVNMSLGGSALEPEEKAALDRAIANGVIVVAAAGNEGTAGMGFPGAYAPVISAGAAGWTGEWLFPGSGPRYRMWWLQYPEAPVVPASGSVNDPTAINEVYVTDFSSRAIAARGQQLDVLAPGSWVRGPFPGDPGFNHLPWWSNGAGALRGRNSGNFFYAGGTSMATPHVASVAALML
ncbi:MAG TPA: S8 family serine peptidase, partial [Burkholderiaceae bacterium]|nr:S8 family serine peptidase [Burkholderiaceae bacterium]